MVYTYARKTKIMQYDGKKRMYVKGRKTGSRKLRVCVQNRNVYNARP